MSRCVPSIIASSLEPAFIPPQMASLAIHLCTKAPSEWPEWPQSSIQALSTLGASVEALLDYLEIVAEEVESADLLQPQKYVSIMQGSYSPLIVAR